MGTLNQAISLARIALNDTDATGYRYSDADLLQYGNDALDAIAHARPELFYSDAEITPVTGKTLQTFSAADSLGLADILYVKNGGVVRQIDRASLDTTYPNWPTATPGAPIHWMRLLNAPNGFVLFPPPEVGVVLVGVYVKAPSEYAGTATLPVSNAFIPPISDYIVFMAESRDDEHVNSGRAGAFLQKFTAAVGSSAQSQTA